MNNPTNMAQAIQKAYCKQILEQVAQGNHTLADLREHEKLCANDNGPHTSLDDPFYLGLQDAIVSLSKQETNPKSLAALDEAIKLLYDPEQLVVRQRDRER